MFKKPTVIIGKSHSSVQTIINSYLRSGNLNVKARSRRPKKFSQREERLILNTVKANPRKPSSKLCAELFQRSSKCVQLQTVRNVLPRAGYYGRTPRRKPLTSKVNKMKRLAFGKDLSI